MIALSACAPAIAFPPGSLGTVPADQRFEIFATSGRSTVDSVQVKNDTLFASGIAVHPAAARTPLALPILTVDSIRQAHTDREALTSTLVPGALIVGLGLIIGSMFGND